MMYSDIRSSL